MKRIILASIIAFCCCSYAHAYDLVVSAGQANTVVSGSKSYTIPKGTASVSLVYNIYSAEYPYYVSEQSIFNDVWSVSVDGPSGQLFTITRQVNSQLTQPPTWLSNSTTGDQTQTIDVSALTTDADITIQLVATSMNVSDSALPTIVHASLMPPPVLTIVSAEPDTIQANNGGNYYSIPALGQTNTLQRTFDLSLTKSDKTTLTTITVTLQGSGDLMPVMQQRAIPSGTEVQILSQTDTTATLRVRVTVQTPASAVNGAPPPARDIGYKFHVEGTALGQTAKAEFTVTGRRSLWRSADVLTHGRYGVRDAGGDDWAARGAYSWLSQNANLINAVDDISGEHGRNIGHTTHAFGTDIDTYHFYSFGAGLSGTANYQALQTAVVTAFGTVNADGTANPHPSPAATQALQSVTAFVTATRIGIDNLANLGSVAQLRYMVGSAGQGLPNGWARALLRTGTVTRGSGATAQTLNLGLGTWCGGNCAAKLVHVSDHNNHIHVDLNRTAIGE